MEDGTTVATLSPSNEQLMDEGKAMDPPPDLIYRLEFVGSVPPEYAWTTSEPERLANGGCCIHRMTVSNWLAVLEREKLDPHGHIGPTEVGNLPRPKERGSCDCQLCSLNRHVLEKKLLAPEA